MVVAVAVFLAALLWPRLERSAVRTRVEEVARAVETVRNAMLDHHATEGEWPPSAPPGEAPAPLTPLLDGAEPLRGAAFLLEVRRWSAVDRPTRPPGGVLGSIVPPGPPTPVELAAVTVHTAEEAVLAGLLDRFGSTRSFVRDTTWTLVFPGADPPVVP